MLSTQTDKTDEGEVEARGVAVSSEMKTMVVVNIHFMYPMT